jgi:TPR repeat protein
VRAADQGVDAVYAQLAWIYFEGLVVEKNESAAFKWFSKAAELNDPQSKYMLGYCLQNGIGTPKNLKSSVEWFEKSADAGYLPAKETLGSIFFFGGDGVAVDFARAYKWYSQIVEGSSPYVQYLVGHMLDEGKGIAKDAKRAANYYQISAERGEARAQYRLAWFYFDGVGVSKDLKRAYVWSNLAASTLTGVEREDAEKLRNYVASKLEDNDLKRAQQESRQWKPKE